MKLKNKLLGILSNKEIETLLPYLIMIAIGVGFYYLLILCVSLM